MPKQITQHTVRMYDTDSAQILFFGNQFRLVNDAFEEILHKETIDFYSLFTSNDYAFVVVHAESDYLAPSRVGDILDIHTWVSKIGNSSFEVSYELINQKTQIKVGRSKSVHVTITPKTGDKIPLPESLVSKLKKYLV